MDHFRLGGGAVQATGSHTASLQMSSKELLASFVALLSREKRKLVYFFSQNVPWLFGECELMLWQDLSSL